MPLLVGLFIAAFGIYLLQAGNQTAGGVLTVLGLIIAVGGGAAFWLVKKDFSAGYKLVVTGKIEKLEIKRRSAKITYELIGNDRVRIVEDSATSPRSYEGPITPPFDEKDPRSYFVTIESKSYELERPDFFKLKEGDPLCLEVLHSGRVLKVGDSKRD